MHLGFLFLFLINCFLPFSQLVGLLQGSSPSPLPPHVLEVGGTSVMVKVVMCFCPIIQSFHGFLALGDYVAKFITKPKMNQTFSIQE
jgi:hypothetical protein